VLDGDMQSIYLWEPGIPLSGTNRISDYTKISITRQSEHLSQIVHTKTVERTKKPQSFCTKI